MADLLSSLPDVPTFVQALLANTTVIAIVAWIAKLWADRRIESIKGDQARKLEEVKGDQAREIEVLKGELANISRELQAGIDKKMMVFKTHFELEFQNYRDLWSYCDEAVTIAFQTRQYYQHDPVDDAAAAEGKAAAIARYDTCRIALDNVRKQRPFIARDISDAARDLLQQCLKIAQDYMEVYSYLIDPQSGFDRKLILADLAEELRSVRTSYDTTAELIATRLSRMYVADFDAAT